MTFTWSDAWHNRIREHEYGLPTDFNIQKKGEKSKEVEKRYDYLAKLSFQHFCNPKTATGVVMRIGAIVLLPLSLIGSIFAFCHCRSKAKEQVNEQLAGKRLSLLPGTKKKWDALPTLLQSFETDPSVRNHFKDKHIGRIRKIDSLRTGNYPVHEKLTALLGSKISAAEKWDVFIKGSLCRATPYYEQWYNPQKHNVYLNSLSKHINEKKEDLNPNAIIQSILFMNRPKEIREREGEYTSNLIVETDNLSKPIEVKTEGNELKSVEKRTKIESLSNAIKDKCELSKDEEITLTAVLKSLFARNSLTSSLRGLTQFDNVHKLPYGKEAQVTVGFKFSDNKLSINYDVKAEYTCDNYHTNINVGEVSFSYKIEITDIKKAIELFKNLGRMINEENFKSDVALPTIKNILDADGVKENIKFKLEVVVWDAWKKVEKPDHNTSTNNSSQPSTSTSAASAPLSEKVSSNSNRPKISPLFFNRPSDEVENDEDRNYIKYLENRTKYPTAHECADAIGVAERQIILFDKKLISNIRSTLFKSVRDIQDWQLKRINDNLTKANTTNKTILEDLKKIIEKENDQCAIALLDKSKSYDKETIIKLKQYCEVIKESDKSKQEKDKAFTSLSPSPEQLKFIEILTNGLDTEEEALLHATLPGTKSSEIGEKPSKTTNANEEASLLKPEKTTVYSKTTTSILLPYDHKYDAE